MSIKLLQYDCTCISIHKPERVQLLPLPLPLPVVRSFVRLFSLVVLRSLFSCYFFRFFFVRFSALVGSFWCAPVFGVCTIFPMLCVGRAMSLQINMHVYFGFRLFFIWPKARPFASFPSTVHLEIVDSCQRT